MGGFAVIAFFLLILTALSALVINDLGQKINAVDASQKRLEKTVQLTDGMNELRVALDKIDVSLSAIIARLSDAQTGKSSEDAAFNASQLDLGLYQRQREIVRQARNHIQDASAEFLTGTDLNNGSVRLLDNFSRELQPLLNDLDIVQNAVKDRRFGVAIPRWQEVQPRLKSTKEQINEFRATGLIQDTLKISNRQVNEANTAKNFWLYFLLIVGLVALLLALGFGLVLTLAFTRPVEYFRRRLVRLADGDLATSLEVNSRDQFGQLAGTFNQSIHRLGSVVEQVQSQSFRVSSAAAQIAAASGHSAMISAEQAGAVAEATVTIEELSQTAVQIADAASLVAEAAEQALNSASDGQATVRDSIVGINNLKNQVSIITERILALTERSQRVGHIIEQVASIADQTHLLALNAAIESAAAGENGKRFGVVAASVKQLAERSRQATKDVQAVLSEIQSATIASVMATEQGLKQAERGVVLAHSTGDANENIIQMVERTVQLASAISLATQQQRSASEQVVSSMRQLAIIIQDGASSAKQSSSLAVALDTIANELLRLSSQFKVQPPQITTPDDGFSADGGQPDHSAFQPKFPDEPRLASPGLRPEPVA